MKFVDNIFVQTQPEENILDRRKCMEHKLEKGIEYDDAKGNNKVRHGHFRAKPT